MCIVEICTKKGSMKVPWPFGLYNCERFAKQLPAIPDKIPYVHAHFLSTQNHRYTSSSDVVSYPQTQSMLQNLTDKHSNRDPDDTKSKVLSLSIP